MADIINNEYRGSLTALVTPMKTDGSLDEHAATSLIERQILAGTTGLIPSGTTGESPTLTHKEHLDVVEHCVKVAKGRAKVMAGAGSNSTREAVEMARHAESVGADSILVVVPYYNKPTQEGLYRHFMTVADATSLPLWLYCIPGRSVVDLTPETVGRLAKHPNIVGTKDATANLDRPIEVRRLAGAEFNQLSGEDGTVLSFLGAGGHGCISVTSNVVPELCTQMHRLWQEGKVQEAIALQDRLAPLHDALFAESSPAPVKYALSRLGHCQPTLRLPLVEPREETKQQVDAALRSLGLLD
ncbi:MULTISPECIES: 4-hydroxy-tetrahydrodipicolinate synthase [unclassified Saccharibacter]|uniref:4-hydroxy-tetrahydrodipicolinate synthase n=1 Tax=unclassified Saccharibacter TaxID=2648722 RepID=UPI0013242309|nr:MULTISPECIES: 4-hydroxy-tetrahydrodipicolinate synthase [unclassified Saccharibacter]MXV36274.1 4-hydroxy-tetrahydrodipicolinate synthase [Saccharibacter sp. EH611]MXV57134.1 4-hydroxy-tetrahydrodipicolinate synthase [Saccharibacter sp. EH70]MXV66506.1 4-hydroxy-tetrahydrodipicolinate synthase [Saccharibacter sp. EH60]